MTQIWGWLLLTTTIFVDLSKETGASWPSHQPLARKKTIIKIIIKTSIFFIKIATLIARDDGRTRIQIIL